MQNVLLENRTWTQRSYKTAINFNAEDNLTWNPGMSINTIRNSQKENYTTVGAVPSAIHIFIVRQNSVNSKQLDLCVNVKFVGEQKAQSRLSAIVWLKCHMIHWKCQARDRLRRVWLIGITMWLSVDINAPIKCFVCERKTADMLRNAI